MVNKLLEKLMHNARNYALKQPLRVYIKNNGELGAILPSEFNIIKGFMKF